MAPAPHVRQPLPKRGGNSFYRDKRDFSHLAASLCGEPITDRDTDIRTVNTKAFAEANWPICPVCLALAKESR